MHRVARGGIIFALAALAAGIRPAAAQVPKLTLNTSLIFFGDDTEFSNPFRTGETLVGTMGRAFIEAAVNERLSVMAGAFGVWRFGSNNGVDQAKPVLSLVMKSGSSRFILGTLDSTRHLKGEGPDRTGPHGLLPPMQQETLSFTRQHESGLQWIVDSPRYAHDAWVNWQRINSRAHREIFDVGMSTLTRLRPEVAIRGDVHVFHQGGQKGGGSEPVADSVAAAAGVEMGGRAGAANRVSLELMALGSRNVPDRQQPQLTTGGFATFVRLTIQNEPWRFHAILWRANGFVHMEGDPLYLAVRNDGTRYYKLRDYAELGLTRRFRLAPGSFIEASMRLHRTEDNYEPSVRVLGVADLRMPIRK